MLTLVTHVNCMTHSFILNRLLEEKIHGYRSINFKYQGCSIIIGEGAGGVNFTIVLKIIAIRLINNLI